MNYKEKIAERRKIYGNPYDEARKLAAVYSAILGVEVTPYQIPLLKSADKLVRLSNQYHKDGTDDMKGYADYTDEVALAIQMADKPADEEAETEGDIRGDFTPSY